MGFWDKKEMTPLDILTIEIKDAMNNENVDRDYCANLLYFIEDIKTGRKLHPFQTENKDVILAETIEELLLSNNQETRDLKKDIASFLSLYSSILISCPNQSKEEVEQLYLSSWKMVVKNPAFDMDLFALFEDKRRYIEILSIMTSNSSFLEKEKIVKEYIMRMKKYYAQESMLKANVIDFMTNCLLLYNAETLQTVMNTREEEAKQQAGIHCIDEIALQRSTDMLKKKIKEGTTVVSNISDAIIEAKGMKKKLEDLSTEICQRAISELNQLSNSAVQAFEQVYLEKLQHETGVLSQEKDNAIREFLLTVTEAKKSYNSITSMIDQATSENVKRISTAAEDLLGKIHTATENESLKSVIDASEINKLLSEHAEDLKRLLEGSVKESISIGAKPAETSSKTVIEPPKTSDVPIIFGLETPDAPINHYFDEKISFTSRFNEIMEAKQQREEEGEEIFHESFDDVVTLLIQGCNPYLIGPSGCGKTYLIKQICQMIGIDFLDLGKIDAKWDVTGSKTADGLYSPSNFYYCYVNGLVAFFDELDSSNPNATTILNTFTSCKKYAFAPGVFRTRHSNFRIIAAGNTDGSGPDPVYNARCKIDESVQQRLLGIEVGYDNRVEKRIFKDYPEWFEFMQAFRKATDSYEASHSLATGLFTTRDAEDVRKHLDAGCFSQEQIEKILKYYFIQTKDDDYLSYLSNAIEQYSRGRIDCRLQCQAFIEQVEIQRQKKLRRG